MSNKFGETLVTSVKEIVIDATKNRQKRKDLIITMEEKIMNDINDISCLSEYFGAREPLSRTF